MANSHFNNLMTIVAISLSVSVVLPSPVSAIRVEDTFSRPDSDDLDVTEVGGFEYLETGTVSSGDVAQIVDEQLEIFGVDGPGGTGPGIALIDIDFADLDISVDLRFGDLDDPINPGTNNTAGFFLRRPGPDVNYTTGEGQIDLNMLPGGAFLIRETDFGALETLYFDTPFSGGTTDNMYSPPGTLPASIGGSPFDADQDGVLEENEPFNLGVNLAGDLLTVKINGEDLFDVELLLSAPPSEISMAGLYKNRFTSAGGLDPAQPRFDNLVIRENVGAGLQAGDADQDLDFDQLDLVRIQIAGKYLTGQPATWGEGDWNGAPGGQPGNPPPGDGQFNQTDIIAALAAEIYLTGPYGAVMSGGTRGDGQTSIVYDAGSGEVSVDTPAGVELTSINMDSAAGIFTGDAAENLGGSFDNDADDNVFKATFGGSFGSVSFGNIAPSGLTEEFLLSDLTVVGSLSGGGGLGDVDLVYVPEPSTAGLLLCGMVAMGFVGSRRWS